MLNYVQRLFPEYHTTYFTTTSTNSRHISHNMICDFSKRMPKNTGLMQYMMKRIKEIRVQLLVLCKKMMKTTCALYTCQSLFLFYSPSVSHGTHSDPVPDCQFKPLSLCVQSAVEPLGQVSLLLTVPVLGSPAATGCSLWPEAVNASDPVQHWGSLQGPAE